MDFSKESTLGELLDNPETRKILVKYIGEKALNNPMINLAKGMTLEQIAMIPGSELKEEVMDAIDDELVEL